MFKPKTGTGYFSGRLHYGFLSKKAVVSLKNPNSDYRLLDVWGLSYLVCLAEVKSQKPDVLQFVVPFKPNVFKSEALKRRISYLNQNNPGLQFELVLNGKSEILYNSIDLINRPNNEKVILQFKKRETDDTPGRLEKDLQAFLFGKSIMDGKTSLTDDDLMKIYRRLAVLGTDFFGLNKSYGLIREFPTGVFNGNISNKTRILPTYFVDVIGFNNRRELAVIELKLNDTKLEVISQLLDYMLFFISYKNQIAEVIKKYVGPKHYPEGFEKKPIAVYVANKRFHPNFEKIKQFYAPKDEKFGFKLYQIILGETTKF